MKSGLWNCPPQNGKVADVHAPESKKRAFYLPRRFDGRLLAWLVFWLLPRSKLGQLRG